MMRARDNGRAQLCERVQYWSQRLKVEARIVRVQRMTRKWGSCSRSGILSLAADLDDRDTRFQDFVIVHELLHLIEKKHNDRFVALMTEHLPKWHSLKEELNRLMLAHEKWGTCGYAKPQSGS